MLQRSIWRSTHLLVWGAGAVELYGRTTPSSAARSLASRPRCENFDWKLRWLCVSWGKPALREVAAVVKKLVVIAVVLAGQALHAAPVKGPTVATESARPQVVRQTSEDNPAQDLQVRRRRYEASVLAPIPLRLLGGMFVFKGDFFKEHRELEGDDRYEEEDDLRNPNVAGVGTVYLPHHKEGAPRFFILAARYGEMSFKDKAGPMSEYVLGADIDAVDMPWPMRFDVSDDASTRVLVRYRSFPGFHRWLLLAGHKIQRASGWSFDVQIPSHVLAGWQTDDQAWKIYGGVKWVSREYPFSTTYADGWMEGHTATRFVGVRRLIAVPLYVALEAGMQREVLAYYDERGETLSAHETEFAPWARVALETWVPTP